MNYFQFNASKAGMPDKPKPVTTYRREPRSESAANREMARAVRK